MVHHMPAREVRQTLERVFSSGSQSAMARLLEVNITTVQRWVSNGAPGPAAILLDLLAHGDVTVFDLEALKRRRKRPRRGQT